MSLGELAQLGDLPLLAIIAWLLWQHRLLTERHLAKIDVLLEHLFRRHIDPRAPISPAELAELEDALTRAQPRRGAR